MSYCPLSDPYFLRYLHTGRVAGSTGDGTLLFG